MQFGHAMLQHFSMDTDVLNVNHASYGAVPLVVQEVASKFRKECQKDPDLWFRKRYREHLVTSRKAVARYIHCELDDVVLVENASLAFSSVLRSIPFNYGDKVLIFDFCYGMIKNTLDLLHKLRGIEVICVSLKLPLQSNDDVIKPLENVLIEHGTDIRVFVCEHISSCPALILPVQEMCKLVKQMTSTEGCQPALCVIDGANALGQIPIQPDSYGADMYIANGHKWLFTESGCAIIWVKKNLQDTIYPCVMSSDASIESGTFVRNFEYTGSRDYTPMLLIPCAIKFREEIGETDMILWNTELKKFVEKFLSDLWQTQSADMRPTTRVMGFAATVQFPADDLSVAIRVADQIWKENRCFIVVFEYFNNVWVRLSCQIYNEHDDYKFIGHRVLELLKHGEDKI
eukprot:957106_1